MWVVAPHLAGAAAKAIRITVTSRSVSVTDLLLNLSSVQNDAVAIPGQNEADHVGDRATQGSFTFTLMRISFKSPSDLMNAGSQSTRLGQVSK